MRLQATCGRMRCPIRLAGARATTVRSVGVATAAGVFARAAGPGVRRYSAAAGRGGCSLKEAEWLLPHPSEAVVAALLSDVFWTRFHMGRGDLDVLLQPWGDPDHNHHCITPSRTHPHARTHTHARERTHKRTHAHARMHALTHTHASTRTPAHARPHMHARTYVRAHARTRTRTHAQAHARTRTQSPARTHKNARRCGIIRHALRKCAVGVQTSEASASAARS